MNTLSNSTIAIIKTMVAVSTETQRCKVLIENDATIARLDGIAIRAPLSGGTLGAMQLFAGLSNDKGNAKRQMAESIAIARKQRIRGQERKYSIQSLNEAAQFHKMWVAA